MGSRIQRWVVESESSLEDFLRGVGVADTARDEGRVFLNRKRVRGDEYRVAPGDVVSLGSPRGAGAPLDILDERKGFYAVHKPASLPTLPDRNSDRSLLSELADTLDVPRTSLGAVSRLDVGVSGIVLVWSNEESLEAAEEAKLRGSHYRRYLGITSAAPKDDRGRWTPPIPQRGGQKAADTRYAVSRQLPATDRDSAAALLVLEPVTGRSHQLRIHTSAAGSPLFGDRRYGGVLRVTWDDGGVHQLSRIALHCAVVELPLADEVWRVSCPAPVELENWWERLGGQVQDFPAALDSESLVVRHAPNQGPGPPTRRVRKNRS